MFDPKKWTPMSPEEYGNEWAASATKFASNAHYNWMIEQLGHRNCVLEIGCGSGEATLRLAQAKMQVAVVEVNEHLISKTVALLESHGITTQIIKGNDPFDMSTADVIIMHASVFSSLFQNANTSPTFDAIICWMIGAQPQVIADKFGKNPHELKDGEMAEYRQQVHSRCYELGQSYLNKNAVIHIVDRVNISSWKDKDMVRSDFVNIQSELSGAMYSITKKDCLLRKLGIDEMASSHIRYIGKAQTKTFVFASSIATLV